jgi:hypothetical protein
LPFGLLPNAKAEGLVHTNGKKVHKSATRLSRLARNEGVAHRGFCVFVHASFCVDVVQL